MPFLTADLSRDIVTSLYLYGTEVPPTPLTTASLIRPGVPNDPKSVAATTTEVDMFDYMTLGAGRFGNNAYQFDLMQRFFDQARDIPPGEYTKTQLAAAVGLGNAFIGLSIHQSQFDDGTVSGGRADWLDRSYIWGTTGFKISDDVVFVVTEGERWVENYRIEPLPRANAPTPEDSDFAGGFFSNIVASYLVPRIDPSGIGRTINFDFIGEVPRIVYGAAEFQTDTATYKSWSTYTAPTAGAMLIANTSTLINPLWDAGIIKFLTEDNKPIFYGTQQNDFLTLALADGTPKPTGMLPPLLAPYIKNGAVLLGGAGKDTLHGSQYSDILSGNALGSATDIEDFDIDRLEGGKGKDIYGSSTF
jgi:hypothetical protein